jgi:DNA polymerase III subunit gamma/tau
MSYTVLARRYRSTGFDDVVGQDHVAQTLKKAIASGRIAHAFLFCGTRGVGKTSMARILAKALNCQASDGPTTTPCGKCASCVAIATGQDIDVIEIDAASNNGVDNVRDITDNSRYRPAASRFKVYIIDEAHMLSKSAFNALLKTLEEPPGHVKFVLATTEAEKIPATIVSRCQRYDFRSISTREIAGHLAEICKGEKVEADEDALLLVAKAGAGSMRDALSLLDRLLGASQAKLTPEAVTELLGLPQGQLLMNLSDAIGRGDLGGVLTATEQALQSGLSADALLAGLIDHLRTLLVLRVCGQQSGDLIDATKAETGQLAAQAGRFAPGLLSQDIALLEELRRQLRSTQAGRALLDATLLRLAMAEQYGDVEGMIGGGGKAAATGAGPAAAPKKNVEVSRHPDPLVSTATVRPGYGSTELAEVRERGKEPSPQPSVSAATLRPGVPGEGEKAGEGTSGREGEINAAASVAVDESDDAGVWRRAMELLSARGHGIISLLADAKYEGIADARALIRFRREHATFARMLERNGKKDQIRDAICQASGRQVGLRLEIDAEEQTEASDSAVAGKSPSPHPSDAKADEGEILSGDEPVIEPAAARIAITGELKEALRDSQPLVRRLMDEMGAEIVKVE